MRESCTEPIDLIQTKLMTPRLSPSLVGRPHLMELLDRGLETRLSLVCAPAGYGKTTLLCSWLHARSTKCAWVTLEPADNDLVAFLSYFIAAIRTQVPNACSNTKSLLNALQLPPPEHLANSLINELSALPQSVCLVLDDYHEIHRNDIHELVAGLVRHPLPTLHLVLATRHDPPFSLVRLRGAEKMTEIRVKDLRFTDEEAQEYLQRMLNLEVEPDLVAKLVERTEGWPVGLRMAALAIRDHADPAAFVDSFHGNHRYITSYLIDETFAHQPRAIQRFLLRTSILDRFCAGLCDAVAGQPLLQEGDNVDPLGDTADIISSQEILERLEKSNLFVTPMDPQGEWFRYHQLFRDLLTHRLLSETTEAERAMLHIAASEWLEENGFVDEALRHRLAANDFAGAAETLARARYAMLNETRWQQIEQWLRSFPPYVVEDHPDLLMIRAWIYYHQGHNALLPEAIENIESRLNRVSLPPEAVNRLQGEMSALKALLQYYASDPDGTITSAEKAIQLTAPELWIVRILARLLWGLALQIKGDLMGAYAAVFAGYEERQAESKQFKAILLSTACWIHWIQSDLKGMAQTADQSLRLSQGQHMPEFTGWAHHQRGTVAYHQNDLALAEQHFGAVVQQPYLNYGQCYLHSACGLALTYQAQNRPDAARDVSEAAVGFFLETGNTTLLAIAQAFQAELALRQDQIAAAGQWVQRLDPIPPLSPMIQFYDPRITSAKTWLVLATPASTRQAERFLSNLREYLERTHNRRYLIEVLALQALLCAAGNDMAEARSLLAQAIDLAQPGGFIRLFVDLGPRMAELLAQLPPEHGTRSEYVDQILNAFVRQGDTPGSAAPPHRDAAPTTDMLTAREMDVLTLLGERRSNKEIADALVISLNTVSTHTRNLFSKLDVHNRRQAVARARELGLLPSK